MTDFGKGLINYSKSAPAATFADIEVKMRKENFNVYLIAMVSMPDVFKRETQLTVSNAGERNWRHHRFD